MPPCHQFIPFASILLSRGKSTSISTDHKVQGAAGPSFETEKWKQWNLAAPFPNQNWWRSGDELELEALNKTSLVCYWVKINLRYRNVAIGNCVVPELNYNHLRLYVFFNFSSFLELVRQILRNFNQRFSSWTMNQSLRNSGDKIFVQFRFKKNKEVVCLCSSTIRHVNSYN